MNEDTSFKQTEIGLIPKDWEIETLSNLAESIFSGGTPNTRIEKYWDGEIPWLSSGETSKKFIYSTDRTITKEGVENSSARLAKREDIVVASAGQGHTRGQAAICKIDVYINQSVVAIRTLKELLNPYFLFYNLSSRYSQLRDISDSHSSRGSLTTKLLANLKIPFPNLKEQNSISQILTSLDDKIELNRKMNEILEQTAQAIFKHWFIDFEFPDEEGKPYKSSGGEMVDTELGEIPKGWRVESLADHISIKHGFAFKGEFILDDENEYILLTPGNFKIGGGFNYNKFRYYHSDFPKDYILKEGDFLITMTDLSKFGDTLGFPAIIPKINDKYLLHNQRLGKIKVNEKSKINKYFLYFRLRLSDYRNFILGSATGSTVKHTSPSRILEFRFVLPSKEELVKFEYLASQLFEQVNKNEFENNILIQIRESILPKLMSGKIRVGFNV